MTLPDIDTVFLTTDPDNLFDEETGIYAFGEAGSYDTSAALFWS